MNDIQATIKKSTTLAQVEQAMAAAGRVSDSTRRELVELVNRSKIPAPGRQAAFQAVMGSLSSVLNHERCVEWWEAASCSVDAVRAAIQCKLPFKQSVIEEFSRTEVIGDLLERGEHLVAWCIWQESMDDAGRSEMVGDMLHVVCREKIPNEDMWMEEMCRLIQQMDISSRLTHLATIFCERFLRNNRMNGVEWVLSACFPDGISEEAASKFVNNLRENAGGHVPQMEDLARQLLQPLRAIDHHNTLDAATPASLPPTNARRI